MENRDSRNFQNGRTFIIGEGKTIAEIQVNGRWIKSRMWVDATEHR